MISTQKNFALMLMGLAMLVPGGIFAMAQVENVDPINEQGGITGHVTAVLRDADGNIKQYSQSDNAIIDDGKEFIADDIFGTSLSGGTTTNNFDFIEIGTNNTIHIETDTVATAFTSVSCPRVQDAGVATDVSTGGQVVLTVESAFAGSTGNCAATFAEALLANAITGGEVLALTQFSGGTVTLTAADTLTITWAITLN